MMRSGIPRSLRPLTSSFSTPLARRWASQTALRQANGPVAASFRLSKPSQSLALTAARPTLALVRHYAAPPYTFRDAAKEAEYAKKLITDAPAPAPTAFDREPAKYEEEADTDMMASMRHDVAVIKETFALDQVPKEALNIGLAGVIPYLVTSASTVFCAVEIHHAASYGSGYLLSGPTAEAFLNVLEPLQVGYGAVILSFLGAIHWGLEWAGFGGHQGYRRYAIGVIAPAVAWPTILMPVEYALITQFLAFSFLYSVDSSAASRGWVPNWYSTYRFVLTFIVGASIVASLIGRGQISDRIGGTTAATDRILALRKASAIEEAENGQQEAGEEEQLSQERNA